MKITNRRNKIAILLVSIIALGIITSLNAEAQFGKINNSPSYLRNQGLSFYFKGDLDSAFDYFQQAIKQSVKEFGENSIYTADLYFELGQLALKSSKFQTAETNLRNAVRINPNSIEYHLKLANVLQLRQKPEDAFKQISLALAKNKSSLEAHAAMINFLSQQGMHVTASQESIVYNYLKSKNLDENLLISSIVPQAPITSKTSQPIQTNENSTKPIKKSDINDSKPDLNKPKIAKPVGINEKQTTKDKTIDKKEKIAKDNKKTKESDNKAKIESKLEAKPVDNNPVKKVKKTKKASQVIKMLPPPPNIPSIAPVNMPVKTEPNTSQGIKLNTNVKIKPSKDTSKPKASGNEINDKKPVSVPTSNASEQPTNKTNPPPSNKDTDSDSKINPDSDFMLDWGSVKKKH